MKQHPAIDSQSELLIHKALQSFIRGRHRLHHHSFGHEQRARSGDADRGDGTRSSHRTGNPRRTASHLSSISKITPRPGASAGGLRSINVFSESDFSQNGVANQSARSRWFNLISLGSLKMNVRVSPKRPGKSTHQDGESTDDEQIRSTSRSQKPDQRDGNLLIERPSEKIGST